MKNISYKKLHVPVVFLMINPGVLKCVDVKSSFGPTKENQIWRVKTNEELDRLITHKNIFNYIKDHTQRMLDTRSVKKIFNWKPLTKRSQGRPKYKWEDNIKQDICQLKIQNWIACIQDRGKWKKVVEKAETFN
jgi:hypothetical protein